MTSLARHIIQRNILEVVAKEGNGYGLDEHYKQVIIPKLAELFDQYSSADKIIRIGRLDIQLRLTNSTFLNEEFEQQLISAIKIKLAEISNELTMAKLPATVLASRETKAENAVLSNRVSLLQAFYFFLQKGSFPWWISKELKFEAFEQDVLNALKEEDTTFQRFSPSIMDRLFYQFSLHFIERFIEIIEVQNASKIKYLYSLKSLFTESLTKKLKGTNSKDFIKIYFLILLSTLRSQITDEEAGKETLRRASKRTNSDKLINEIIRSLLISNSLTAQEKNKLLSYILLHNAENLEINKIITLAKKVLSKKQIDFKDSILSANIPSKVQSDLEDIANPEYFFIENAGIVLLCPFLERFFQNLDLTHEKAFKDFSSQTKAIHLLHFLAEGSEKPVEHKLILLKVICGLPINFPIEREIELSSKEKNECTVLLLSVIEHWSALKSTSVDGLREGFLQRAGKLTKQKENWLLHVQQETHDILLNRLPWSIGFLMLPWMKGEKLIINWI